jgi:hypothetical protein
VASDDVQVINVHKAGPVLSVKSSGKGTRITTTVTSQPITVMLDEGAVAKRAAEVLARTIREQTERITQMVKPATAAARRTIEKAFARGEAYAVKRFTGGRTGVTPPRSGENRKFNHSGRLARSIVANYSKKSKEWFINYAANRWRPEDFKSMAAMQEAFAKWVALVPVLQDASSDLGIQRAIRETVADILHVHGMGADHKRAMQWGKTAVEGLQKTGDVLSTGGSDSDEEAAA